MCLSHKLIWVDRRKTEGDWEQMAVPCGKCWQCRLSRRNDFAGRCMAESYSAEWSAYLTLTYAPRDDGADKVIQPRHFQDFIRALRDARRPPLQQKMRCRYMAAGEYGSLKSRAHFHVILFGWGPRFEAEEHPARDGRFYMPEWPHGHVNVQWDPGEDAVTYCAKYVTKAENDEGAEYWLTMSKKPPLGHEFFMAKAKEAAELGVVPQGFRYLPPGADPGHRRYVMTGATRRNYLAAIFDHCGQDWGVYRDRFGEWPQKALDRLERWLVSVEDNAYSHHVATWRDYEAVKRLAERNRPSDAAVAGVLQKIQPPLWLLHGREPDGT